MKNHTNPQFWLIRLSLVLFSLSFSQALAAQETADSIIQKYLLAIGGTENWAKLNTLRQTGKITTQGVELKFVAVAMRPNLTFQSGTFQDNSFIDAFDGTIAWEKNVFTGKPNPVKKDSLETLEASKENFEDDFINYREKGFKVELNGKQMLNERNCYRLLLRKESGEDKIYFLNDSTFLPVMVRSFPPSRQLEGKFIEVYFADYRQIEGFRMPYNLQTYFDGQRAMIFEIEKIEINPVLDKKLFIFPEEK
jgi:hypothetical protein